MADFTTTREDSESSSNLLPLTDSGEVFGLAQYSSVSTVIQNVKQRLNKEPSFNKGLSLFQDVFTYCK